MASIDVVGPDGHRLPAGSKAPKGARYRARWRTPTGASRTKTFKRKLDAERFLASVTVSRADGTYTDPQAGRVTLGVYAEQWASAQPHRQTTAESVEQILRNHIIPTFGVRPIAAIRTSEVQAWVSGLELAPLTVRVVYGEARRDLLGGGRGPNHPALAVYPSDSAAAAARRRGRTDDGRASPGNR